MPTETKLKINIMKNLKNSVRLIGNLGKAPEVKEAGNSKLAKFSLATNESYRNAQGEKVTETQWHNIVVWGKQAELVEKYLQKGSEVAIEGKLSTRMWEDKDGKKHYTTEIIASDFLMLGKMPQA